ncbi:unnamed protein product [Paramecium octaurelia]|uniref:Uncharacterized protein n=1 Tax=Paramecium octaurelia TaxID=43137 RepID=A0A8S1YNU5_PAROT|nr:unnamed protein product [Paramecium octaurelia]
MQINCDQAGHQNQSIIGFCIDITCKNLIHYCNFCLPLHDKHFHMLTPLNLINEWVQQRILRVHNVQNNIQDFKGSLDDLLNWFDPYFNFNINQMPELGLSEIDNLVKNLFQIEECEKLLFRLLNQLIEQVKQIVIEILKTLKRQTNLNEINNSSISRIDQLILEQPKHLQKLKSNLNHITYEFLNKNSIEQQEYCYGIAFNQDCSIAQMQLLNQHQDCVTTLNFMKKSNQLISGDLVGSILIWSINHNNQWICPQQLEEHNDRVNCLIVNNNEDIIISILDQKNEWTCQQTITHHKRGFYQLSLNDKQNKVFSYGDNQLILVIEYQDQNKQWMVIQNIQVDSQGFRLCYINDNLFTFHPKKGNLINAYEMNNLSKQYIQTKTISVNLGNDFYLFFPQQYINSKQLLVSKHDNYVNLIRKTDNDQFKVDNTLFGCMSDDGQYLITWDDSSKEIQIRICKEE